MFGKELGYQALGLKERAYTSSWIKVESFDQVLNNFKASYFSGALLLNRDHLVGDLKAFFRQEAWSSEGFYDLMETYTSSPETFMSRLTNLLPKYFNLTDLFFLRFNNEHDTTDYELTKELHLSRLHNPHATELQEHYCRRWVSIGVLKEIERQRKAGTLEKPVVDAQVSEYVDSENRYLVISIARPMARKSDANSSVSIGLLISPHMKRKIGFWNDPRLSVSQVNDTCERCPLTDCEERAVPPYRVREKEARTEKEAALRDLLKKYEKGP